ncbi:MAG: TolB family protein, partial [Rhodanobacteraceae bacterium]
MHLILGLLFSLNQVLSYPFPDALVAAPSGHGIAYVLNERGVRSLWYASGPNDAPRMLWSSKTDDGQELTGVSISKGAKYVVFARGGDHDANWDERPWPDPDGSPAEQHMQVMSVPTAGGQPNVLGDGDAPVISPDGAQVAFVHDPDAAVWSVPIAGGKAASRLFFDRGHDGELAWSPGGGALAFTSDRGDHSFVGIYRNATTPLEYIA